MFLQLVMKTSNQLLNDNEIDAGKKIVRKRPGSRCEADLALQTGRVLPPPFLLWLLRTVRFQRPLVIICSETRR